jgi:hypothetical protein
VGLDLTEWSGHLAAAVIAHAASVTLVAWLLKRRILGGERIAGATVLRYPRGWHVFAWTYFVGAMCGLGWLAWRFPPKPHEMIYLAGLVAGFGLTGAYLVLEVSGIAHEIRPNGFMRVSPWGRRRFLPWAQVSVVRYSGLVTAWHIRTKSGDTAWVAHQLSGLGPFAEAVLENVPASVIDRRSDTRPMLAAVAAGVQGRNVTRPPRLW